MDGVVVGSGIIEMKHRWGFSPHYDRDKLSTIDSESPEDLRNVKVVRN